MKYNWLSALEHLKFIKKKPRVIFRIIKGYFNKIVLGENVLRTVDFAVTYNCHYQCEYCSALLLKKGDKPILTVKEIDDILKQAFKLGAVHVNLTGGEPLTRDIDELCQIIRNMSPKKIISSLVTNSMLVTREKLSKLKEAGLDTISISIESLDPEKNDKLRGVKGAFTKTMETIGLAKEIGLNICLSAVLCHDNRKDIEQLLEYTEKEDIFLLLNPASSVGRWRGEGGKKMIEEDIAAFEKLMRHKRVRSDISFNFNGKRGCPGGTERIYVSAYGDVFTCPLVHVGYGNLLKEPLEEIFNRMNSLPFIKKYFKLCKQSFDKDYYEKICKPAEEVKDPPLSIFVHPNRDYLKDVKKTKGKLKFLDQLLENIRISKCLKHCHGRVLDIGCGNNNLIKKYKNGVGVDVFPWPGVDIVCDTTKLPFKDEEFDTVFFIACLNHIPNREVAINEAFRVLKPGGRIVITMIGPVFGFFWHKIIGFLGDRDQRERGVIEGEVWGISSKDIKDMLINCGFKQVSTEKFELGLNTIFLSKKS